ncbi:MAG: DUF4349 domain-containing protein [Clostridia bacterium]|nr:DUF4349 domain-containing protein [Clostridia bacterium]
MKNKIKIILTALVAVTLVLVLASCSKAYDNSFSPNMGGADIADKEVSTEKLPGNSLGEVLDEDRKIIKNVYESIHTDKYDDFMSRLRDAISEAGGYISSASYNGSSYYNEDALRRANLVIRVPAENLDKFTTTVDSLGIVYSYNESMSDVTAAYVDVESRISVLKAEETALLEMLSLAKNVSETLEIRTRLNQVQSDLASLEAQKKTYDSLVAYSTINMSVSEVRRAESVNPSFFEEVSGTFSDSLADIGDGLRDFAVWFLGNIIYIIIFSAFVTGGVFLIIKLARAKRAKKQAKASEENEE